MNTLAMALPAWLVVSLATADITYVAQKAKPRCLDADEEKAVIALVTRQDYVIQRLVNDNAKLVRDNANLEAEIIIMRSRKGENI